ncbi:MAG: hypothetical protein JXQ87_01170 [Bacteroidia bacterium]
MRTFKISLLLIAITNLMACSLDDSEQVIQSESKNVIMPLGASRVEGARPEFESYRYELWKLLVDKNFDIDFIGTNKDYAQYNNYLGKSFDPDHEGWSGWTSGEINRRINKWLNQISMPDIVLFSTPGGNDALQNLSYDKAISNVNEIIDKIQSVNPNVTIIIESPAPAHSSIMQAPLSTFLSNMQDDVVTIAKNKSTPTSMIIVADMASGFGDDHLADDVHYNEAGARLIASKYFKILENVLKN